MQFYEKQKKKTEFEHDANPIDYASAQNRKITNARSDGQEGERE